MRKTGLNGVFGVKKFPFDLNQIETIVIVMMETNISLVALAE